MVHETHRSLFAACLVVCASAWFSIHAAAHTFTFNAAILSTGTNPQGIVTADLNGDGRPDVIVSNFNDNTVSVLIANVDGSYQPHVDYQVGTNPIAVTAGDMNNDGKIDVIVVNNNCPGTSCTSNGSISVLLGNGDGTLQTHIDQTVGLSPNGLALGDLNGDKVLDVVATNGQSNSMSVLLGNGNGTLKPSHSITVGINPHGVVLGNFDGDMLLDAVVANTGDSNIGLLRGTGQGFHTQVTFATGANPASLAMADFNQDGKPDIVTGNTGVASVSILTNNPFRGGFLPAVDLATTDKVNAVVTGDFNNDGFIDVAAACTDSDVVSIEYGHGDSTFQFHVDAPSGSDPVALAAADITGDGLTDLLIANDVDNSVYLLPGVNPNPAPGSIGTLGLQDMTTISVGNMPNSVATGDFNNDGTVDLAIADRSDNNLLILLGNGDGTFTAALNEPVTGNKPSAVIAVDLNKDGRLDLVATNATDNTISVFLGNGDGSFQPGMLNIVDKRPVSVVAADFNSDGKIDLAVANQNGLDVSVLLGNGDGTFQAQKTYTTGPGSNPLWLTAADFGNGKIDLAVANNGSGTVAVLLGNGDGTFTLPVAYSTGSGPSCVAFGDFNADGNKDLAVTNSLSNNVSILLGNGTGTFQSHVDYATAKGPFFVAVPTPVDVDQDGKQDLVIGASAASANRISILLGNGDGTFQDRVDHLATSLAQGPSEALGVADFNGDRAPDIAAANQIANTVSIFLNNPVPITIPASFNFGALNLGASSPPQIFNFTNSGSAPLNMLAVSLTGTSTQDFSISSNDCGTTLAIDGACAPRVVFAPTDVGTRTASLTFTDNAPSLMQKAALTGVGNGAGVGLNATNLTFPPTVVGSTSVTQTVTLTNYGNMTLTLSITKSGANRGDFAVSNTCNGSVIPGATCKINVRFSPLGLGPKSANVVLTDNAKGSPQTIPLSGVGTDLSISAGSLNFGSEQVGMTSMPMMFTITNTSTTMSVSVSISITGTNFGDFAQTNNCGAIIPPNSSCTVSVTFTPTATGSRSASVSIADGSSGTTLMVPLSGTGI